MPQTAHPEEDLVRISIGEVQVRVTPPASPPNRPAPARPASQGPSRGGLARRCIHP
ncbi:MAG: hypothetical protein AB1899_08045 [Pseudomonadota bacterium]